MLFRGEIPVLLGESHVRLQQGLLGNQASQRSAQRDPETARRKNCLPQNQKGRPRRGQQENQGA